MGWWGPEYVRIVQGQNKIIAQTVKAHYPTKTFQSEEAHQLEAESMQPDKELVLNEEIMLDGDMVGDITNA